MRSVAGKEIGQVAVIDDDEASRKAVAETVADGNVQSVPLVGPLGPMDTVLANIRSTSDALVSDHHLTKHQYASFGGAEVVAKAYRERFPAVLCTGWAQANIVEIRALRRWIPSVINSDDATDPEVFISGFKLCIEEFRGEFSSARKPWRALVRVEAAQLDGQTPTVYVVVSSWHPQKVIGLLAKSLPSDIVNRVRSGTERFHAQVNKGAESDSELFFDEWTL
jgi:hypothetical protein